jgi:hypothetical protein
LPASAAIVFAVAYRLAFPIVGAAVCFAVWLAGIHQGVVVPTARSRTSGA